MRTLTPEVRRLRSMQHEVGFVLLAIITALVVDNPTLTFVVLLINAFLWALMLQQIGRDLAGAKSLSSPSQGARMKQ